MGNTSPNVISNLITALFQSKTITPTYKIPHILYVIMLIGKEKTGIGRYRIKTEIGLGEGSSKTLLNRLKEENVIIIENHIQKGHILSEKGWNIYTEIEKMFSFPEIIENPNNEFVVGKNAAISIIKHEYIKTENVIGITQRDEAIKIGGTGATSLIYNGEQIIFPGKEPHPIILQRINQHLLQINDIILIGGGDNDNSAVLATFAGILSLISF